MPNAGSGRQQYQRDGESLVTADTKKGSQALPHAGNRTSAGSAMHWFYHTGGIWPI